jgi:hypothetical protein
MTAVISLVLFSVNMRFGRYILDERFRLFPFPFPFCSLILQFPYRWRLVCMLAQKGWLGAWDFFSHPVAFHLSISRFIVFPFYVTIFSSFFRLALRINALVFYIPLFASPVSDSSPIHCSIWGSHCLELITISISSLIVLHVKLINTS